MDAPFISVPLRLALVLYCPKNIWSQTNDWKPFLKLTEHFTSPHRPGFNGITRSPLPRAIVRERTMDEFRNGPLTDCWTSNGNIINLSRLNTISHCCIKITLSQGQRVRLYFYTHVTIAFTFKLNTLYANRRYLRSTW